MKYKILYLLKDITEREYERVSDLMQEYFKDRVPFDLELSYININDEIEINENDKGWYTMSNTYEVAREYVKDGEYHQVMVYYNADKFGLDNKITAAHKKEELIKGTRLTSIPGGRSKSNKWERISSLHETMHAFCGHVRAEGQHVFDHMDVTFDNGEVIRYLHNDDPTHPDGNYARTFKSLEGKWDLILTRPRLQGSKLTPMPQNTTRRGYMSEPNYFVLHHGADSRLLTLKEMRGIYQNTHFENLYKKHNQPRANTDTPDIAYHLLVGKDGWEVARPFNMYGYHASNYAVNKDSIALCITGNYSKQVPTEDIERYVIEAMQYIQKEVPSVSITNIHRDFVNKECPGNNITREIMNKWWNGQIHFNVAKPKATLQDLRKLTAYIALAKVINKYPDILKAHKTLLDKQIK